MKEQIGTKFIHFALLGQTTNRVSRSDINTFRTDTVRSFANGLEPIDHKTELYLQFFLVFTQNGTLKIIDRRKHIFKLSQGEYIIPEKIENCYCRSQYVSQVFVHGESLKVSAPTSKFLNFTFIFFKSCIVAVVVPDVDVIKCWAQENGIPGTFSVLCNNPEVKQLIMDDMLAWGKEMGLKSFEQASLALSHATKFLFNGVLFSGERYLFAPRPLQRPEWTFNSHDEIEEAAAAQLLQASVGGHVQESVIGLVVCECWFFGVAFTISGMEEVIYGIACC